MNSFDYDHVLEVMIVLYKESGYVYTNRFSVPFYLHVFIF